MLWVEQIMPERVYSPCQDLQIEIAFKIKPAVEQRMGIVGLGPGASQIMQERRQADRRAEIVVAEIILGVEKRMRVEPLLRSKLQVVTGRSKSMAEWPLYLSQIEALIKQTAVDKLLHKLPGGSDRKRPS